MQEVTVGEIHRNKVEINRNNILKTIVFNEINKIGSRYYQKNPRKERNFGDWEVKNNRDTEKRELDISKEKGKQHLKINFEQKEMTGFDFTLSDGKTIVSLQKSKDGKMAVTRIDITGKPIPGSEDLSAKEYLELSNFPVKFWIDRNVNAIVDTVDPSKFIRYATPILGLIAGAGFATGADKISAQNWKDLFLGPTSISQSIDSKNLSPKYSETPNNNRSDFAVLNQQDSAKYNKIYKKYTHISKDPKERIKYDPAIGLIDDLKLVHEFTLPNTDGLTQKQAIEKFLMEAGIPSGELFIYRQSETNNLPQSLKDAIDQLDSQSMPYKEDQIFDLIKALREFNGGKISTPKDIIQQANKYKVRKGVAEDPWGAYQQTKDQITGLTNFNNGPIQVSELFESATPESTIVNTKNQYGIVMEVSKNNSGNLVTVTVWRYDEISGLVTIEDLSGDDFALNFR